MQEKRQLKGAVWNQSSLEESKSSELYRLLSHRLSCGSAHWLGCCWTRRKSVMSATYSGVTDSFWMRFSSTHFHISQFWSRSLLKSITDQGPGFLCLMPVPGRKFLGCHVPCQRESVQIGNWDPIWGTRKVRRRNSQTFPTKIYILSGS